MPVALSSERHAVVRGKSGASGDGGGGSGGGGEGGGGGGTMRSSGRGGDDEETETGAMTCMIVCDGGRGACFDADDGGMRSITRAEGSGKAALVVKDALGVSCEDGPAASATLPPKDGEACSLEPGMAPMRDIESRRTRTITLCTNATNAVKKHANPNATRTFLPTQSHHAASDDAALLDLRIRFAFAPFFLVAVRPGFPSTFSMSPIASSGSLSKPSLSACCNVLLYFFVVPFFMPKFHTLRALRAQGPVQR